MGRHQAVESGGSLYDAMAGAVIPALAPATALSQTRSNAQRKQLNHAYSDQQHHERHGIVIQPVSVLCAHDIPLVRFFSRSGGAKGSGRVAPGRAGRCRLRLKWLILLSYFANRWARCEPPNGGAMAGLCHDLAFFYFLSPLPRALELVGTRRTLVLPMHRAIDRSAAVRGVQPAVLPAGAGQIIPRGRSRIASWRRLRASAASPPLVAW